MWRKSSGTLSLLALTLLAGGPNFPVILTAWQYQVIGNLFGRTSSASQIRFDLVKVQPADPLVVQPADPGLAPLSFPVQSTLEEAIRDRSNVSLGVTAM